MSSQVDPPPPRPNAHLLAGEAVATSSMVESPTRDEDVRKLLDLLFEVKEQANREKSFCEHSLKKVELRNLSRAAARKAQLRLQESNVHTGSGFLETILADKSHGKKQKVPEPTILPVHLLADNHETLLTHEEKRIMAKANEIHRRNTNLARERLPKQPEPGRSKSHWDYVLDEMVWMATDFREEFKWKSVMRKKESKAVMRQFDELEARVARERRDEILRRRRQASFIGREIRRFWSQIDELAKYERSLEEERKKKEDRKRELDQLLDKTAVFTSKIAENFAHAKVKEEAALSESADLSDSEFDENLSSEIDNESTLDKEEKHEVKNANEVSELENEASVGIDEVLRMQGIDPKKYRASASMSVPGGDEDRNEDSSSPESGSSSESRDSGSNSSNNSKANESSDPSSASNKSATEKPVANALAQPPAENSDSDDSSSSGIVQTATKPAPAVKPEPKEIAKHASAVASAAPVKSISELTSKKPELASKTAVKSSLPQAATAIQKPTTAKGKNAVSAKLLTKAVSSHQEEEDEVKADIDFEVSNDADEEDDEATMDIEEKFCSGEDLKTQTDKELLDLQKELERPIEDILREYMAHGEPDSDSDVMSRSGSDSEPDPEYDSDDSGSRHVAPSRAVRSNVKMEVDAGTEKVGLPSKLGKRKLDERDDPLLGNHVQDKKMNGGRGSSTRSASSTEDVNAMLTEIAEQRKEGNTRIPIELLTGSLRSYQHVGLDWLVALYERHLNGILADEMGLGKTIMTIALLCWLAVEKEIWGPHLIIVPTSVMLNWEVEFKKWAPGLKVMSYFGSFKERKKKREGWTKPNQFHVCITSYQLVVNDASVFRRKRWKYIILDEAQNIKNFQSQRWQTLMTFHSKRRLLLTGTPLQNSVMELWSLMHFLMPDVFQSHSEFKEWFNNPLLKATESGMDGAQREKVRAVVERLHKVLRPFVLRRLKSEVEKGLPPKHEHVVLCHLSKRQRELYEDFMARGDTKAALQGGNFMSVMNVLMQLRKVCNHPDLFESRPIVSPLHTKSIFFPFPRIAGSCLDKPERSCLPFISGLTNVVGIDEQAWFSGSDLWKSPKALCASSKIQVIAEQCLDEANTVIESDHPVLEKDEERTNFDDNENDSDDEDNILDLMRRRRKRHEHDILSNLTKLCVMRCDLEPIYGGKLRELVTIPLRLNPENDFTGPGAASLFALQSMVSTLEQRADHAKVAAEHFGTCIAAVRAPCIEFRMQGDDVDRRRASENYAQFRARCDPLLTLFRPQNIRSEIVLPDARLVQWDCGKLQRLADLLRKLKEEGHRCLIFSQMTKMLDVLESFLNLHSMRYLRLDGSTKTDQRQRITERFNTDNKIFCMILSTRSGGVGLNLVGADCVIFYDTDWNPAMDAQAQDRAHRIGQTRPVHIYRVVTDRTIEMNILRKAQQKRNLESLVISQAGFTTEAFEKHISVKGLVSDIEQHGVVTDGIVKSNSVGNDVEKNILVAMDTTQEKQGDLFPELLSGEDDDDRKILAREREVFEQDIAGFEQDFGDEALDPENIKPIGSKVLEDDENPSEPIESKLNPVQLYAFNFVKKYGYEPDMYRGRERDVAKRRPLVEEKSVTSCVMRSAQAAVSPEDYDFDGVPDAMNIGSMSPSRGADVEDDATAEEQEQIRAYGRLVGANDGEDEAGDEEDVVYEMSLSDDLKKVLTDPVTGINDLLYLPLRDGGPDEMVMSNVIRGTATAGIESLEDAGFFSHAYARLARIPEKATRRQREKVAVNIQRKKLDLELLRTRKIRPEDPYSAKKAGGEGAGGSEAKPTGSVRPSKSALKAGLDKKSMVNGNPSQASSQGGGSSSGPGEAFAGLREMRDPARWSYEEDRAILHFMYFGNLSPAFVSNWLQSMNPLRRSFHQKRTTEQCWERYQLLRRKMDEKRNASAVLFSLHGESEEMFRLHQASLRNVPKNLITGPPPLPLPLPLPPPPTYVPGSTGAAGAGVPSDSAQANAEQSALAKKGTELVKLPPQPPIPMVSPHPSHAKALEVLNNPSIVNGNGPSPFRIVQNSEPVHPQHKPGYKLEECLHRKKIFIRAAHTENRLRMIRSTMAAAAAAASQFMMTSGVGGVVGALAVENRRSRALASPSMKPAISAQQMPGGPSGGMDRSANMGSAPTGLIPIAHGGRIPGGALSSSIPSMKGVPGGPNFAGMAPVAPGGAYPGGPVSASGHRPAKGASSSKSGGTKAGKAVVPRGGAAPGPSGALGAGGAGKTFPNGSVNLPHGLPPTLPPAKATAPKPPRKRKPSDISKASSSPVGLLPPPKIDTALSASMPVSLPRGGAVQAGGSGKTIKGPPVKAVAIAPAHPGPVINPPAAPALPVSVVGAPSIAGSVNTHTISAASADTSKKSNPSKRKKLNPLAPPAVQVPIGSDVKKDAGPVSAAVHSGVQSLNPASATSNEQDEEDSESS